MAVLYQNLFYNEVCYKGNALLVLMAVVFLCSS